MITCFVFPIATAAATTCYFSIEKIINERVTLVRLNFIVICFEPDCLFTTLKFRKIRTQEIQNKKSLMNQFKQKTTSTDNCNVAKQH